MTQEDKIRKRKSYKEFKKLYYQIKDKPTEELLRVIYQFMDSNMVYGSYTNSFYAKESLELFINDTKNEMKAQNELSMEATHHEWSKEMIRHLLNFIDAFEAGQPVDWNEIVYWKQSCISHLQQTAK